MATRTKTVEFAQAPLTTMVNNTLTTMTQMTVYLPETGTKTFRSVVATICVSPIGTGTGNITNRQVQCRLGAAGYTANTNANTYTGSVEDIVLFHAVDLTSHFTTNWTGTSMTFDTQVSVNGSWAGVSFVNITCVLSVTYDYDDTSTTQVKTVRIPLNAPVGALATTKPGTATATIPLLNTELPEASKVYRNQFIVIEGQTSGVDQTFTLQLDATAAHTTQTWEGAGATDMHFRYAWNCTSVLDETISMGFYIWGSTAEFNHVQAYLVCTYEFDSTSANDVFVSLILPVTTGVSGAAAADYQRVQAVLDAPEAGIVSKQIAFFADWAASGLVAGLNFRVGTGSFVAYTDAAAVNAGTCCAMVRNDSAFTIARGRNTLTADMYDTETAFDIPACLGGFFIVNYTCDKPTGGHGAVTHSVREWLGAPYSGASAVRKVAAASAPVINETDYYVTSVGGHVELISDAAINGVGAHIEVERLSAEGGVAWDQISGGAGNSDFETGLVRTIADATHLFRQFPSDLRTGYPYPRRDLETSRRWRAANLQVTAAWFSMSRWYTYHSQTWTVSGTVAGSSGGTVTIDLHDATTGEKLKTTSRSGNGSYSFTWYDPVRTLFTQARESGTRLARSDNGVAV
jgi:hypothetical protein